MTSPDTQKKSKSPMRGLFIGLVLAIVFFPAARHFILSSAAAVLGLAVGALIALLVLFGPRRGPR